MSDLITDAGVGAAGRADTGGGSFPAQRGAGEPPSTAAGARRAQLLLTVLTALVVAGGTALRVRNAVVHQSIMWPDEIYQMTESAHRVLFGYGITPWEFRQGTRSWLGPGLIMPPMLVWKALGLGGLAGMTLVRVWVAVWCGLGAGFAAMTGRRLAGPAAGLLAACLVAFSPISAVYEMHPLADSVAAPMPVLAVALLCSRGRRRRADAAAAVAGVLLVASVVLRPQLAVLVPAVALAVWIGSGRRRLVVLGGGLGVGALASGLLDTLTWGIPFVPVWRSVTFNVIDDGASKYGRSPFYGYLSAFWHTLGPVLLALLAVGLLLAVVVPGRAGRVLALRPGQTGGDRVALWPVVAALGVFLLVLSAIGHKEVRFLLPALPLASALAAVGLDRGIRRVLAAPRLANRAAGPGPARYLLRPAAAVTALAVVAGVAGAVALPGVTSKTLQYPGRVRSAWGMDDDTPHMLALVGQRKGVCGVALLAQRVSWSGGYSFLHRNVPFTMVQKRAQSEWAPWANAVVIARGAKPPAGYHSVLVHGTEKLAVRSGRGAPAPAWATRNWI